MRHAIMICSIEQSIPSVYRVRDHSKLVLWPVGTMLLFRHHAGDGAYFQNAHVQTRTVTKNVAGDNSRHQAKKDGKICTFATSIEQMHRYIPNPRPSPRILRPRGRW